MYKFTRLLALTTLVLLMQPRFVIAGSVSVDVQTTLLDGTSQLFGKILPGDTIYLVAGQRDYLLIRNFYGLPNKPYIFINKGGIVTFDTDHAYGISIQNCRYFKLTGSGVTSNFYGIEINRVANGAGIGIGALSSDFEIDHVSIRNVLIGGIYAKTDPDCSYTTTREKFTQYNTIIHDNYVENSGNEGLYIGSTKYTGQTLNCNGKDTLLMPSLLDGVRVYNNIIKYSGWDGIQVSSAFQNCQVYDNMILFDSQAEYVNQMSGIMLGGGSKCDCYNNYISDGKGCGIENHGLGGNRIFNNIIVNAGITYAWNDFSATKMKYGIFVTDNSVLSDSSFYLMNNTIVNPKSDGIRFASVKSKNSLISSNAIINPGNFDYYENGNTQFKGENSYVMIPDKTSSVLITNNYFSRDQSKAGFYPDFSLQKNSPLIDAGYTKQPRVSFDFKYHIRRSDNPPDIGAYEYDPQTSVLQLKKETRSFTLYPNPVKKELTIGFQIDSETDVLFIIYDIYGNQLSVNKQFKLQQGTYSNQIEIQNLPSGLYLCTFQTNHHNDSGKFIKIE